MLKRTILSLLCMLSVNLLSAAPITRAQAAKAVMTFFSKSPLMNFSDCHVSDTDADLEIHPYYIFNMGSDKGFVIASGDDAVHPVLGYSYEGSINVSSMPENLKLWLECCAHDIAIIQKKNLPARKYIAETAERMPVTALLKARWDQKRPFNNKCPYDVSGKYHRPTGCVATAIAQVMYHHKWPQGPTSPIEGYSFKDTEQYGGDGSEITLAPLEPTTFDWEAMLDSYDDTLYSERSADAVAELMMYVGHSVEMMYGVKASAAFSQDIPGALVHKFGYKNTARLVYRSDFKTQRQWEDVIYTELSENRPVIYSGITKLGSGHQFVCDGYEDGYFHINWGWSGESNGFYLLYVLDPSNQGIGGAGDGSSFSELQTAVIGVQKPYEDDIVYSEDVCIEQNKDFDLEISLQNTRRDYTSIQFDLQLPEGMEVLSDADGSRRISFNQFRSENADHIAAVNKMSDGKYRIIAYSPTNSLIKDNDGVIVTLAIKQASSAQLRSANSVITNVITCDSKLITREIRGSKFSINIKDVSGINSVMNTNAPDGVIYNIEGTLMKSDLNHLKDGIYIIDGKKILVR